MQHSPDLQRASLALPLVPEAAEMRPADVNDAAAASPTMEPTTERQVDTCHAIRLNVPEMDTNNLPSFFCALEHWFAASGITAKMDNRRFHIAMAQIPLRLFSELQPLLGNVPATDRYDFVKKNHPRTLQRISTQATTSVIVRDRIRRPQTVPATCGDASCRWRYDYRIAPGGPLDWEATSTRAVGRYRRTRSNSRQDRRRRRYNGMHFTSRHDQRLQHHGRGTHDDRFRSTNDAESGRP